MTKEEKPPILKHIGNLLHNGMTITGPPYMITTMEPLLKDNSIDHTFSPEDVGNLVLCFTIRSFRNNKPTIMVKDIAQIKHIGNSISIISHDDTHETNICLVGGAEFLEDLSALLEYYKNTH